MQRGVAAPPRRDEGSRRHSDQEVKSDVAKIPPFFSHFTIAGLAEMSYLSAQIPSQTCVSCHYVPHYLSEIEIVRENEPLAAGFCPMVRFARTTAYSPSINLT